VDEQVCSSCGAQRKPGTDFCWQCYTPYGRPAAQPVAVGAGPLGGGSPSPGPVAAGPLARPGASGGASMVSDALRGRSASESTAVPTPGSEGPSWIGPAIKVVVFVAFAVGGFLAWRFLTAGFPFPDAIEGKARIEGEQAEEFSRLVEDIAALADAEVDVALYGEGPLPAYMMFVAEYEDPGVLDLGALADPAYVADLKSGKTACTVDVQGATCSWLEGEATLIGVGSFDKTPEQLLPVARGVRSGLD
jgi:hypothetical protein